MLKKHYDILVTYDDDADAAYLYLNGKQGVKSARTVEVTKSVYVDFDKDGKIIGIEVLGEQYLPDDLRDAVN